MRRKFLSSSSLLTPPSHIVLNGELISLATPKIMGILNLTEDSFYDGGKYPTTAAAIKQTEKMLEEGAAIIDIGAFSSRPNASLPSPHEEWERLKPILPELRRAFPHALFSLDTFSSETIRRAYDVMGAFLVNDISAGKWDDQMFDEIANKGLPYIMMHLKGTPETMNEQTHYQDLTEELIRFFAERIDHATQAGIQDIIIDPGFGFAKTVEQNHQLLRELGEFSVLERPILVGISRKSMIWKVLRSSPAEALNGTTALHMVALQNGATLLRAHDVKEANETLSLFLSLTS